MAHQAGKNMIHVGSNRRLCQRLARCTASINEPMDATQHGPVAAGSMSDCSVFELAQHARQRGGVSGPHSSSVPAVELSLRLCGAIVLTSGERCDWDRSVLSQREMSLLTLTENTNRH